MKKFSRFLLLRPSFWSASISASAGNAPAAPVGMVWVAGGDFVMGSDDEMARRNEQPPHRVKVDEFWMVETSVTNAQFRKFTDATGYLTMAERKPEWEELEKAAPSEHSQA